MGFPNYVNKHREEALINPGDFMRYEGLDKKKFPDKYIITYQKSLLNYFKRKYRGKYKTVKFLARHKLLVYKNIGLITMSGIGAPYAVVTFEEMISAGGRNFINIGTAGGLQKEGIFLCERAIRDEGTSHHYKAHGKYAFPDKKLTAKLEKSLKKVNAQAERSTTWTIDAPYRETKVEIRHYKNEGVSTVEMESSALFTVAKLRKVKIASAFVVSDVLGEKWEPKFHHINLRRALNKLVDAAIDCLS